jgi:glycosyltransferase involved in cell wall biosynthesis
MVRISCFAKLHSFNLAEQLDRFNILSLFYTSYSYQKNIYLRKFTNRIDKENISVDLIKTILPVAIFRKVTGWVHSSNELFDLWVESQIKYDNNFSVFIGWSGMSLHSLRHAKKRGKTVIVERGSTHICYQNQILHDEYSKWGINYNINPKVIEKELNEYEEADFISIPSTFVKNTFLEYGISESKLIVNPYGSSNIFHSNILNSRKDKFKIIYLGVVSIQKGFKYFLDSIKYLRIPVNMFEVLVIGAISNEMREYIAANAHTNIKYLGHINHYELPRYISDSDVAVQPSLQEGMSMVVLQLLSSGIPVIATVNTGASDIIVDGYNGYLVPIRSAELISEKLEILFNDNTFLNNMKFNAALSIKTGFTWDDYGKRYNSFISNII